MAPVRKKSKPNTDTPNEQPTQPETAPPVSEQQSTSSPRPAPVDTLKSQSSPRPSSWYSGGSWRSKASPVAQIARESISVAKGATSESLSESSRRPSQSVSKSVRGSRKSVPLAAEATRVHATSDVGDKSRPRFPSEEKLRGIDGAEEAKQDEVKVVVEDAPLPPEPGISAEQSEDAKSVRSAEAVGRPQSGAWFGWWSRPDGYGSDVEKGPQRSKRRKVEDEVASSTPLPGSPSVQPVDAQAKVDEPALKQPPQDVQIKGAGQSDAVQPETATNNTSSRSWFGLWSSAQNEQAVAEAQASNEEAQPAPPPDITVSAEPSATEPASRPEEPPKKSKKENDDRPKSSGWAFWSSDRPNDPAPTPGGTQKEVGELAVADTPSQSHPEAAQFNEQREQQQQQQPSKAEIKRVGSLLKPNRGRSEKAKESSGESSAATSADSKARTPALSQATTPIDTPSREVSEAPTPVKRGKLPQTRPNLILPTFHSCYPPLPQPGYLERLSSYLAQTLRLPGSQTPPVPQHVYITPTPPKVKRAVAIGIHGFFVGGLIQKVMGQPTGTSIRFASYAATAIKDWCQQHQPEVTDLEIEKVALEGEGLIADRVSTLWKLLLNWLSHLRQADFILLAAHSQGVPVAFMLLAKLIQLGCLRPGARIGVCAMAGINLGPFLEYKGLGAIGGSAPELFAFCDSKSAVSQAYVEALDVCLRHGVRVTFIGGLDDQLVSLESALYAPLSHPYVNRAVFIDGRVHAPNFLTHLVIFALKLRNRGISDHGLLRELSAPLAGSLVGGEGHSRVYDDPAVYRLALDFALESTDVPTPSPGTQAPTATSSLLATDRERARSLAAARRASLSGYPSTLANANSIRRGSVSASTSLPGIAPMIAHYEAPSSAAAGAQNPFYLPWAVRGMLSEEAVKSDTGDGGLWGEVEELVKEFEEWKPTSKVLRDVRWRLEGVRSMM